MSSQALPAFVHSPSWSRYRRLAFTGPHNPSYVRGRSKGRWTRYRRHRLEAPLEYALRRLSKVIETLMRVQRLPIPERARFVELAGRLTGDWHPDKWALRETRPGKPGPRWYVPRCAWSFCMEWLRQARQLERLLTLTPALIAETIIPLLQRGPGGQKQERRRSAHDEVERLRAWSQARGLAWEAEPT